MLIPILAVVAGLSAILFIVMAVHATRRAGRIQQLERELAEQRRAVQEASALREEKTKQVDELRRKLDRAKDDAKKAKKKAFDQEQAGRRESPDEGDEALVKLEQTLLEARSDAKKFRAQAEQGAEEAGRARAQTDRLKAELAEAKHALELCEDELAKARTGEGGKVQELTKKAKKLEDKLKAADKRSRNDAQVYRVTNSKLELAMEKIGELERQLAKNVKT